MVQLRIQNTKKMASLVPKYICEILDSDGCYYQKYSLVG